jgi:branched-chain amino acid transport system ATP-binding protein
VSLLELHAVGKQFGGLKAVDSVSLSVERGEVFAIIGPNGAGKTTAFNMIAGELHPSDGRILFDGADITHAPAYRIAAAGINRTFQNIRLFPSLNLIENVVVGAHRTFKSNFLEVALFLGRPRREERAARAVATEWLEFVGFPAEVHGEPAGTLPYGRRRLLEMARALAARPRLLLLDEPTAGMNDAEADHFIALVQRLGETGTTVILIEHNMRVAMQVSNRVAVLSFGRLLALGPPAEVRANPEVIQAYLGTGEPIRRRRKVS